MEEIKVVTVNDEVVIITLAPLANNSAIEVIDDAKAEVQNEAKYQICEGGMYEFGIDSGYRLEEFQGIVASFKINNQGGRITPGIYVGTLPIKIIDTTSEEVVGVLRLEVQSVKPSYREDYRRMLEEIAEKCTELLMQHTSPVVQSFTIDFERVSASAYQRFAFIKSIIDSDEFESGIHKIIMSPTTKWKHTVADKPIQAIKKFNRKTFRQLASSSQRVHLASNNPLKEKFETLPAKIQLTTKEQTVDTPENRFIKFALESFLRLCNDFSHLKVNPRLSKEALLLCEKLEQYLNSSVFREISTLSQIPLNNPVLQRKEGYREVYRAWILFDLAAKLIWNGGDDVYEGNKRDVAVLYEYWLFFKLIDVVVGVFDLQSPNLDDLLQETNDGLSLKLRQGEYLPISGISDRGFRKLHVQLSYNRTYKGDQDYPNAGSWSRNLRPDYTLTIWPYGISELDAEQQELIVHIHFDAKYKVENFQEIFSSEVPLSDEKEEQRKGTYKRADLLKMHAYRDAIRRTAGAYVLYPGNDDPKTKKGFHEIVPGLGAFAIRPTGTNNGIEELKEFLREVISHLMNRASQREKISFKTFETYKDKNSNQLKESLPEAYGPNRNLIPDDTFVLVAYYKKKNWNWILEKGLYNARTDSTRGSLRLGPGEAGAKYLLLHTENETATGKILKIIETGPRVFSKQTLERKGYPTIPSQAYYLVYKVEEIKEVEFQNKKWDIKKLPGYKAGYGSPLPFSVTLTDLMRAIIKD